MPRSDFRPSRTVFEQGVIAIMKGVWKRTAVGLGVIAMAVAVTVTAGSAGASKKSSLANYPRSQTLITSGTQWGNIAGTNPYAGN